MYLYGENVFETIAILHVLYAKEQAYTANRECEISTSLQACNTDNTAVVYYK